MKKLVLVFILVTIPFFLFSQEQPYRVEPEKPFIMVSQDFSGSVSQVKQFMSEFMKNFFDQQLMPSGQPLAIFYNAPRSSSDRGVKMEIGIPVPGRVDVKSPLKIREVQLPPMMKSVHRGRYEALFDAYVKLRGLAKSGELQWSEQFVIHRFLNNPDYVQPNEILTEVLIPLAGNPAIRAQSAFKVGEQLDLRIVYRDYKGSVNQLGDFVNDFMKSFYSRKLSPAGQPVVVFSRAPRSSSEQGIQIRVGFPVGSRFPDTRLLRGNPPLRLQRIRYSNVAVYEHMGPYEKIFDSQKVMLNSVQCSALRSRGSQVILILENNPALVKPEEIKVQILLPVSKR